MGLHSFREKERRMPMELREIKIKAQEILENFVEQLGMDGESYISMCDNCPMAWGKPKMDGLGEYITPRSKRLQRVLNSARYDEKTKKILNQKGLILIANKYRRQEIGDRELFVSVVHEMLHANRNLLVFDVFRDNENESAYVFNNEKFEQSTSEYSFAYVDASQEVLKGNIDTCKKTVESYKEKSQDEIENMVLMDDEKGAQMERQKNIDEAFIELMSRVAYKLYARKEKQDPIDVWQAIEEIKDVFDEEDIGSAAEIVLRHHDLEVFKWMLDPIGYSQGDIHYDFFAKYTENDRDLVEELHERANEDTDEIFDKFEFNEEI